ncbi:ribulose-phosphate 3-epimerase [Breznakia sp. PF5-3]|uniref:ribulose-phosphate 3-epimerase n=1 Tax=unclassified Breznakia TaxID=2623764 RepID=UPI0024071895|nr:MULTISPECIES: ribulose-phosphate 3-epimerase [unclassified Breznakia]MDF9824759.1 ribulose-phosphate 3-epimerase [Breznakia sp. PM6-1]MDF9835674.1 ribulose-phosphate 3-epimerase [Breznakia sp. PF5-3]MDF9837723.1 ribulose-phosphate 3-epimerase [Breznakia sp. PFB2-8]MDF9859684.1 ribulose-phosphate 3-epimerase [Breznakia sp. PH5-24]
MKVLGLGDNVVDVYRNLEKSYPGGNALNNAVNAAKLNYQSAYLGNFADDMYGEYMQFILKSMGIDISKCVCIHDSTTKKCIVDVFEGERNFVGVDLGEHYAGCINITAQQQSYIEDFDIIFTSCNAKIEEQLYKLAKVKGIVSYDFGEKEKYRTTTYLSKVLPYIDFAQFSINGISAEEALALVNQLQIDKPTLITRGGESPIFIYQGTYYLGKMHKIKAKDTMGAGDAFITKFITQLYTTTKGDKLAEEQIGKALHDAGLYASEVCKIDGGFGFPYLKYNLQGVLFDMDGVLVDSEQYWVEIAEKILYQHGYHFNEIDKERYYGCSLKQEVELINQYIEISEKNFLDQKQTMVERYPCDYQQMLMPYAKDLIIWLKSKGVKLGIVSSSTRKEINEMLIQCQLQDVFTVIVSGDMVKHSKPNPEIYQYAMKEMKITNDKVIVIEDSGYGIKAAQEAGLNVIAMKNQANNQALKEMNVYFASHDDIKTYLTFISKDKKLLCPSMMCADYGSLKEEVLNLDAAGVDIFHCDVMDGSFVPNMTMGIMDIKTIRKYTKKMIDVHLMVENPLAKMDLFIDAGADIIYIHPEAERYVIKAIMYIKSKGKLAGIAINPDTSVETIKEMLKLVDYVMIMSVNPGFTGQDFIEFTIDKIKQLAEIKKQRPFKLIVDGAITIEKMKRLNVLGVDGYVLGTSSLFKENVNYKEQMKKLRNL